MSTIATLAVALVANHQGFVSGMEQARRSHDLFSSSVKSARSVIEATKSQSQVYGEKVVQLNEHWRRGKIDAEQYAKAVEMLDEGYKRARGVPEGFEFKGLIEAVAAVEIAHRALDAFRESYERAASTTHLAASIGVTTTEMGKLTYAAKLTETPIDSLTASIGKMQKNLAEAASGASTSKHLAETLGQLGLNARELAEQSPVAALGEIADAIRSIENPAQRTAAAMAIFGKGGREMIPFLLQGKQGIAALGAEALKLHAALSEDDTEKLEQTARAFHRTGEAINGAVNQGAIAVGPYLKMAADWATSHQQVIAAVGGTVAALGGLAIAAPIVSGAVSTLVSGVKSLVSPLGAVVASASLLAAVAIRNAATNESWSESCYHVVRGLGLLHSATQNLSVTMQDYGESGRKAAELQGQMAKAPDLQSRIEMESELVSTLHERLEQAKAIKEQELKAGTDVGIGDKQIQEVRDRLNAATAALEKLEEQKAKLRSGSFGDEDPAGLKEMEKNAKEIDGIFQRLQDKLVGLRFGPDQVELLKLQQLGASSQDLADYSKLAKATEAAEAQKKLADQVQRVVDNLRAQIETHGKSAAELEIYKLRVEGASAATIAFVRSLQQQVEANAKSDYLSDMADKAREAEAALHGLSTAQKAIDDFKRKFKDATPEELNQVASQANAIERAGQMKKYADEAKRLADSGRSATEKHVEQLDHLKQALEGGAITWEQYALAVKRSNEELEKASRHSQSFKSIDRANTNLAALAGKDFSFGAGSYVPPAPGAGGHSPLPPTPPGVANAAHAPAAAAEHAKLLTQIASDLQECRRLLQ